MAEPSVSIIIRAHNEAEKIGACLSSVFSQRTKRSYEVIIVYSKSNDDTLSVARRFPVKIVRIKSNEFSFGRALNVGCKAARGEYLVFLSAHAIPVGRKWLDTLLGNFRDPRVAGVYGKEIPDHDCNPLIKRRMQMHWKNKRRVQKSDYTFCNPDSAIRRSVWEEIRFNENLMASEDHDWAKRVQGRGYPIVYEPKAKVRHSHNDTPMQVYTRRSRQFYSTLLIAGRVFDPFTFFIGPYRIFSDTLYIVRTGLGPIWVLRSVAENSMVTAAAFSSFFKRSIRRERL